MTTFQKNALKMAREFQRRGFSYEFILGDDQMGQMFYKDFCIEGMVSAIKSPKLLKNTGLQAFTLSPQEDDLEHMLYSTDKKVVSVGDHVRVNAYPFAPVGKFFIAELLGMPREKVEKGVLDVMRAVLSVNNPYPVVTLERDGELIYVHEGLRDMKQQRAELRAEYGLLQDSYEALFEDLSES